MADKLMYIPIDDSKNFPFSKLQLVVKMFEHSTERINKSKFNKSPRFFLSQRLRKHYYNTLGTSVINSSLSPNSLQKNTPPPPPLFSIYLKKGGGGWKVVLY